MKIAILGLGEMGSTVVKHLKKSPEVTELIAYDIQAESLKKKGAELGIQTTTDFNTILNDPKIPLVFVTASNDAHKELAMKSLEAKKAVMCEKPMANTVEDAQALLEYSEKHQLFLQIGFELRYSKLYTTIKDWIDSGKLGKVVNTHCYYICSEFIGRDSWRVKTATGGSMFGEKLSHYVDLPRWWIGSEVKDVFTVCAPNVVPYYEIRDNYHTVYRFENGAVSQLTFMIAPAASFNDDPLQNFVDQQKGDGHNLRYLVVGTKGAAEVNVFERTIKRWEFGDSKKGLTSTWVDNLAWKSEEDHHYFHNTEAQTLDIVKRVKEGKPPMTSARDSFETMRVCFAAEASADLGKLVELR